MEREWASDPFEVAAVDGYLYGRGTSDNKVGARAAAPALTAMDNHGQAAELHAAGPPYDNNNVGGSVHSAACTPLGSRSSFIPDLCGFPACQSVTMLFSLT